MKTVDRVPTRPRGIAIAIALVLVATVGCSAAAPTTSPGSTPSTSAPAPTSPSPSPSGTAGPSAVDVELLAANAPRTAADPAGAAVATQAMNAFGLDLYRSLADPSANAIVSPSSIALALAMARLGAAGDTAAEMDAVLHGLAAGGVLDPINALDAALAARNGSFRDAGGVDHEIVLRIANAPFGQRGLAIRDGYLEALASGFGAGLRVVDFIAEPELARGLINAWVADATEDRIEELLTGGTITSDTRLVLVNAIYLKAAWQVPFPEAATRPAAFTLPDGSRVDVPMMNATTHLSYAAGPGWQAIELPYVGGALAMTIFVPDDLGAFVRGLTAEQLANVTADLEPRTVDLSLPKFGFETRAELSDLLAIMGMPSAFDAERADFSAITAELDLVISKVIHQANIDVDEKGTEAAAATAVVMDTTGGPVDVVTVRVDRPFLFAIRDRETGAVVFLGQVTDPRAT
jgi:serpin B